jgi:hypothetical protein
LIWRICRNFKFLSGTAKKNSKIVDTLEQLFLYQSQKVHLLCLSLSFLAEAQPRLDTSEDKRHIKFFIIGKITYIFILYLPFPDR